MDVNHDLIANLELFFGPSLPDHDAGTVQLDRIVLALEWPVRDVHKESGMGVLPREFRDLTLDLYRLILIVGRARPVMSGQWDDCRSGQRTDCQCHGNASSNRHS